MQTIINFKTALNPFNIHTQEAEHLSHSEKHMKTFIMQGKWGVNKAIAKAKKHGAVEGTIKISHAEIYAGKSWQRFNQEVATA